LVLWVHGSWFQKKNVYLDEEENGMRLTAKDGSSFLVVTEEFVLGKEIAWGLAILVPDSREREAEEEEEEEEEEKEEEGRFF